MKHLFCTLLAVAFAQTLSAADGSNDAKSLQGTWTPIKAELAAQPMPDVVLKTITLKIGDGDYTVTVAGEAAPDQGTWTIDPAATPKRLTISSVKGPNAGKTLLAIYELDGDTLRVCYDLSGMERPAEFKTAAGSQLYLVTYTRQKS